MNEWINMTEKAKTNYKEKYDCICALERWEKLQCEERRHKKTNTKGITVMIQIKTEWEEGISVILPREKKHILEKWVRW